jgi:hypothetical protein
MKYRITRHSTAAAPADALDRLSARLSGKHQEVSFSRLGTEISATIRDDDLPVSMTRDERTDKGRRVVLEVLSEVCERVPDLKFDWYAVGPA